MPVRPLAPTLRPKVVRRPEVLAPAGDWDSLRAGLAAGADAVYFGLDDGFNARARALNFPSERLPEIVAEIHDAGARAYVTFNTLLFETEVETAERLVAIAAASGVDALIVQDPAICLIARELCPELEVHASTQMTVSSAEGVRFAQTLGVTRVVVPRELSVSEIAHLAGQTDVELEVFIHGALCMSWSGQCLSSEAWGGRSANRGQCAQACRLPYDLLVDDELRPTGDVRYLLSPRDLNGVRAVPALMEAGVHTLKIEGRLKGPAYVSTAVGGMRRWVEHVARGDADSPEAQRELSRDVARMMLTYSRGFSDGFLAGSDHQTLVEGRFPKHRGRYLGRVVDVDGNRVHVRGDARPVGSSPASVASPLPELGGAADAAGGAAPAAPSVRRGVGIGFDTGRPDANEPGGPLFDVEETADGWVLSFGRPGPNLSRVSVGDRVWITSDPEVAKDTARAEPAGTQGRIPLVLTVRGAEGEPLTVDASIAGRARATVSATTESALSAARDRGLDEAVLTKKLAGFGGTSYHLDRLDVSALSPGLHLPVRELKTVRRALVAALDALRDAQRARVVRDGAVDRLREAIDGAAAAPSAPTLVPLCRTDEQLDAVISAGLPEVELDWMEMVGLGRAFDRARDAGMKVTVATVRVQKPGEEGFDRRIAKLEPDGVLVRHWGALMHFLEHPEERRPTLHGDFSLNVTNAITAAHLLSLGLDTFTAAHDLDATQLGALLDASRPDASTVVVHHHIPTFHTEHCVYAHQLSDGRDYRSCGRPCEAHRVSLRDGNGLAHPVVVDVGCRNTVFNAQAQSAASIVPDLVARGVGRFRIEFVWERRDEAEAVIAAYQDLLAGRSSAADCVSRLGTHEQFGVTAGTMRTLDPGVGQTAGARRRART